MKEFWLLLALAGCSGEGARLSMSFPRKTLYDAPFPSDDLRLPDGHIDVSKIPNPNHVELIDQGLQLLARDARGFALAGGVFFRSQAPLDEKTLPDLPGSVTDNASVFLVGVDAAQPDYLKKRPISVAFLPDGGPFGDKNLLSLVPLQGAPLLPRARYAAVVTSRVHDATGLPLSSSLEGIDGLPAGVRAEYRDALAVLPDKQVVALAVFTTDDPTAELGVVRDDALASHNLGVISTPAADETFTDYCVYHSTVDVPVYQSGTPPYDKTGGDWRFDDAGKPIFDHMETARIVFTIPRTTAPTGGWPAVIFVRTGGGGDRPMVDHGPATQDGTITPGTGPAMRFARAGFAGIQIDGPIGGLRNTTNGDEQFLIFNVFNAAALRDNVRQSALELILLTRALEAVDFDTLCGRIKFDINHLGIMGHSMGGWIAPITMAYEPSLGAAVLSGAGGSYIANVMDKLKPLKVRPLAEILLDYNMDQRSLSAHDPALTIVQWGAESSDPQVYGARINAHVLMLQGIVDHYILPSIANATSLAMGLDLAGPAFDADNAELKMLGQPSLAPLLPLVGRSAISLPASGAPYTKVVTQHPEDGLQDGHEIVFQTETPKHQYQCFLQSFAKGTPRVPADGAGCD